MSLFDSASLVVTPNGYKEDKLYSIKPTDGSGDLVVTRATTATRVNSDGLIEVTPYNLLTYSEQFNDAAWVKTNVTVTANATTAPSGNLSADKIIATATNSNHIVSNTPLSFISSQYYNFSYYAKSAEYTKTAIRIGGAGYGVVNRAEINLSTGTIIYQQGFTSLQVESVTNGWYRIQGTFISATGLTPNIQPLSDSYSVVADNYTFLGNGTSGIFVWGAQLVQGTSAKEYFPTTDRLDVPRLDYTNSSCPSILVEPQRTNLLTYSEQFNNAAWLKINSTITANNTTSPDGTQNADKLFANVATTTNPAEAIQLTSQLGSTSYSYSIYAKKSTSNFIALRLTSASGNPYAWFNLNTGAVGTVQSGITASIQNVGNGWYRCTIVGTTLAVIPVNRIDLAVSDNDGNFICANNGSIFVWGAQLEAGSYATSYIPTIASSVTRNADVISKTGLITNNFLSATGGTWFVDLSDIQYISGAISFYIGDGGSNLLTFGGDFATKYLRVWLYNSGTSTNLYSFPFAQRQKIAFSFTLSQLKIFVNGVLVVTRNASLNCNLWTNFLNDNTSFSCRQNSMMFFNTQLTDAECIELTTI